MLSSSHGSPPPQTKKEAASYFKDSMPHFSGALPHGCAALEELDVKYKIEGIPTLVVVDAKTGALITSEGASARGRC